MDKVRASDLKALDSMEMPRRLDRRCEIHEQLIDDVAKAKIESIQQAYGEAKGPVTGEVVETSMVELREHTNAIAAAIPSGIEDEVDRYGAHTGRNIDGLKAQTVVIRRRLQLRANQAERRADLELTELMQRDAILLKPDLTTVMPSERQTSPKGSPSKIFIGHGQSNLWKDLKDFLVDRLQLQYEEFNRESVVGRSTKERLEEMLNTVNFAFIVMTAEDEHKSGSLHPRPNVIHEAGLFQGRLGFERAIILMEEDCSEFSNIHGLTQIRFPKGHIDAKFEEVRRVLEREGIIGNTASKQFPGKIEYVPRPTSSPAATSAQTEAAVPARATPSDQKIVLPITQEALSMTISRNLLKNPSR